MTASQSVFLNPNKLKKLEEIVVVDYEKTTEVELQQVRGKEKMEVALLITVADLYLLYIYIYIANIYIYIYIQQIYIVLEILF